MKRLMLVRHAKAASQHAGARDFDRILHEQGVQDAMLLGQRLKTRQIRPDAIVASPSRRAYQTAELLAAALHFPTDEIDAMPAIYDASAAELLAVVRQFDDAWRQVILVGHNPGVSEAVQSLAAPQLDSLPPCAVVGIAFDLASWQAVAPRTGRIIFCDYPLHR